MTSSAEKVEETRKLSRLQELILWAEAISDRICFQLVQLIRVAGFDGDRASFIRGDLSRAALRYAGGW
ncbi:MAG: hypothetical protein DME84_05970 [Verrucomicrobia bacterium]|jgi:hypothetical protein|nr:MAG: hypothetical protein DME84_05970 [Verrucomicrobiota bacterium]PYK51738.1 MAG: hypothetical protein DME51_02475 [Verrucomicrobiota bacterium]